MLQAQEVRQPGWADAFGTGGVQQDPVDGAEPGRIFAEHGAGQDVPSAAMGARAVQVSHLRQHTGRRPREKPTQRRHRLGCSVRGTAAKVPVVHHEGCGQAQQRLYRQERHLPAALNWAAHQKHPELLAGLADRQVQVISQVSHAVTVLPCCLSGSQSARHCLACIAECSRGGIPLGRYDPPLYARQQVPRFGGRAVTSYRPMTQAQLANRLADTAHDRLRWKLVWELLEEYRWEPPRAQPSLLEDEPSPIGDERWDALLAALAKYLAAQHDLAPPDWAELRVLLRPWFPAELKVYRAEALVWAPAAFSQARRLPGRIGPQSRISVPDCRLTAEQAVTWRCRRVGPRRDGTGYRPSRRAEPRSELNGVGSDLHDEISIEGRANPF